MTDSDSVQVNQHHCRLGQRLHSDQTHAHTHTHRTTALPGRLKWWIITELVLSRDEAGGNIRPMLCDLHVAWTVGWRRGVVVSGVRRMNEVNARRARLVPGWVTVFGRIYHLGM